MKYSYERKCEEPRLPLYGVRVVSPSGLKFNIVHNRVLKEPAIKVQL